MLKQKRQLFELLFVAADLFVVTCAWLLAYWIRFTTDFIPVEKGIPPLDNYLSMLLFIWLIWAFVFKRMGLYRPMRGVRRSHEIWLLLQANTLSLLLFISVTYLFREKTVPYSRLVFVYFGVLAVFLTLLERSVLRSLLREIRRQGYNLRYMLVIGAEQVARDVIARIRAHRELGIQLVGCLSRQGPEARSETAYRSVHGVSVQRGAQHGSTALESAAHTRVSRGPGGIPIIGSYADLPAILKRMEIDQAMVALPLEDHHHLPAIMSALEDSVVDVRVVPDIYQFVSVGGSLEEFEGLPIISVQSSPLDGIGLIAKRVFDLVIASVLVVLAMPFMVLIALLVKLTSKGPIFYKQERVSLDGTRFTIYKFRTMRIDAEREGPQWSRRVDSRVTALGRFLRRYNLDELPQLFNVLRGDMSIVGPRPERPVFISEFRRRVPRYMLRHKVPAGMTGWAQVHGWRGDTSIDKRIEYDLYYIENWSLQLDLKILFLTLLKGFGENHEAA